MSKTIATRIKNVLLNIIHHNETGFIKDHYIGETVRSIFDIMDLTAKQDIPSLLIFIDFRKAFDSLEHNFLQRCLESFNFGPNFMHWVMTFYKNKNLKLLTMVSPLITSQLNEELGKEIHFLHISLWWWLKPWLLQLHKIQR